MFIGHTIYDVTGKVVTNGATTASTQFRVIDTGFSRGEPSYPEGGVPVEGAQVKYFTYLADDGSPDAQVPPTRVGKTDANGLFDVSRVGKQFGRTDTAIEVTHHDYETFYKVIDNPNSTVYIVLVAKATSTPAVK